MSISISTSENCLRIDALPNGYKISPCAPRAHSARFAGEGTVPVAKKSPTISVTPTKIEEKTAHFICPIDYSKPETIAYYSTDVVTGKNNLWDANLAKLYGLDESKSGELLLQDWGKLIVPEDRKAVLDANNAVYTDGDYHTTYHVQLESGERKTVVACGTVMYDPAGKARLLLGLNQVT